MRLLKFEYEAMCYRKNVLRLTYFKMQKVVNASHSSDILICKECNVKLFYETHYC